MTQNRIPASVLFCCDHNSIRSPIAEGMMKKFYGRAAYVQSAGVKNDMEVDGFAIAVCDEAVLLDSIPGSSPLYNAITLGLVGLLATGLLLLGFGRWAADRR